MPQGRTKEVTIVFNDKENTGTVQAKINLVKPQVPQATEQRGNKGVGLTRTKTPSNAETIKNLTQ